jgi:hypothetical protein
VLLGKGRDMVDEGLGHLLKAARGDSTLAALLAEKLENVLFQLQVRLIDVEVHAIDALEFQSHMGADDIGDGVRYTHGWLRSSGPQGPSTALRFHAQKAQPSVLRTDRSHFFTCASWFEAKPR